MKFIRRHFVILLILISCLGYMFYNSYSHKPVSVSSKYSLSTPIATFTANINPIINTCFDNTFFATTGNSTKLIDAKGSEKWNYINNFNVPSISQNGSFVSVCESHNGKLINVFNASGFLYSVKTDFPILDAKVNQTGFISVLTHDNTNCQGVVYDDKGQQLVSVTMNDPHVYPISIALSNDNRVMAVSAIDTKSLNVKSDISLSYVNPDDAKNVTDLHGVFSGIPLPNEIAGKIQFIGTNLLVYTDKGVRIYKLVNSTISLVANLPMSNDIDFVKVVSDKYIFIVLGSAHNSTSLDDGTVLIYNMQGKKQGEFKSNRQVSSISPTLTGAIVTNGKTCTNIDVNGSVIWTYTNSKDLSSCTYIGDKYLAILVENSEITPLLKNK